MIENVWEDVGVEKSEFQSVFIRFYKQMIFRTMRMKKIYIQTAAAVNRFKLHYHTFVLHQ